jgi:ubiquinone/menaquinone biosynthesis C-methylase UbiE
MATAYVGAFVPPFVPLYLHIAQLVSEIPTRHLILDVGTGPGEPALTIAKKITLEHTRIFGADFSSGMIAAAQNRLASSTLSHKEHMTFKVVPDIATLPDEVLKRGNVDIITCALVLQYVRDQKSFLESIHSFLKPGGTFIVVVWKGYKEVPFLRAIKKTVVSCNPSCGRKLETEEEWRNDPSFSLADPQKFISLIQKGNKDVMAFFCGRLIFYSGVYFCRAK